MKKFLLILGAISFISAVVADPKFSDFLQRGTLPGNGWTVGYIDSSNGLKYNVRYPNSVFQGRLIQGTGIVITGNVISAPGGGGGGSLDTASAQFRKTVAKIANDSAQTTPLPFAPKFFQVINGQVYPKGGYYSPSVLAGSITGSVALQAGSTDMDGVIVVTITGNSAVTDGTNISLVSFGETYLSPPSITITGEQNFPGFKLKAVSTTGWTLAAAVAGTMTTGTSIFHYHVLPR